MKTFLSLWLPACLTILSGIAVASGTSAGVGVVPNKNNPRGVGGSSSSGGTPLLPPAQPTKVRFTTHFTLSEARDWTSTDGKALNGKLVAFDDIVVEGTAGAPPPPPPTPTNPTVVKDGKVRLQIQSKYHVVPLDRLCQADRELIGKIRDAHARPQPAKPAAGP